jgi:hypothetical protein
MKLKWEVDDSTAVEATLGGFGKKGVFVNGTEIPGKLSLHKKNEFLFDLPGERHAAIAIKPQFASAPAIELRVDGQLMVPTEKKPALCSACGTVVKPNDRFCGNCGQTRPPAENYLHQRHLKEATTAIWTLAVLFCLFGIVMFFITQSQANDALAKLDGMSPDALLPNAMVCGIPSPRCVSRSIGSRGAFLSSTCSWLP